MNDQPLNILTITLAFIVACNFGVLWLYFRIYQWTRTPSDLYSLWEHIEKQNDVILNRLSEAAVRQRGMKQALLEDGKRTRKDIQEVKTTLRDDEKDDQERKRELRNKHAN